jgi:hypothetical protein
MNTKRKLLKAIGGFGGGLLLLAAFVPVALTQQYSPSTLTPSANGAAPGASFRVDMSPGIGADRTEGMRMVLRPPQAQGPQSDVVLRIVEYHGSWFLIRVPQDAPTDLAPGRLLLVNSGGDILASSGNRLFRIASVHPPVPQKAAPSASAAPRASKEEIRAKEKLTTPGVAGQAREAQVMTTPGVAAKAKRIPTPVTDYIAIGVREIEPHVRSQVFVFNLPADTRLDGPAVFMFLANPNGEPVLEISINGHEIKRIGFHEGTARTWHISFNARGILLAGRNELEISCQASFDKLTIDDLLLWFHRDIEW